MATTSADLDHLLANLALQGLCAFEQRYWTTLAHRLAFAHVRGLLLAKMAQTLDALWDSCSDAFSPALLRVQAVP